jgi:hypothetical protein
LPWVHFYTDSGLIYYFNPDTGVTSWEVPVEDTKEPVQDTKEPVQDTKLSIQDSEMSIQDTKVYVQDTKVSIQDIKVSANDTHKVSSAHHFDTSVQDVTKVCVNNSNYNFNDDGNDVSRGTIIIGDDDGNMNMLEELNAVVINDDHDGDDDYDDDDNNNIGRDDDTLVDELSNLVIEEYIEADNHNHHHHHQAKNSSGIEGNSNCLIEQEEDEEDFPTLFKKIRTIKNLDTGEEYVLDDSEEAAMIYDTFASKSTSRSIIDGTSQELNGLSSAVGRKKKMKVFGIKSLLKKMNMNEQ